ncbi:hypothetical protein NEOLEDRAFT_1116396 [Neolentinus lepideus HHB14362 ss-1]|uniref:NCS1 nucleoside transporter family n=1 Tax=Neolentinus lepideus HHB14362 ss-1 TaxID=1314782 RepID=A0A165RV07_9AGAM|nr:hypothetical protein NEOLEDRAFT_1116396 [Neolentinus lepideus HHB14362 ss-1]
MVFAPKVSLRPVRNWAQRLRHATTSKDAFLEYICTEGNAKIVEHPWSNEDLKPSPPSMINWRWYNFCIFWFGMGFGNWTLGSSVVAIGLNWYEATFVILCAAVISGTCMAFNSRAASTYHVGYPVVARSCFGMYGHYWPVACRGFCAMLWVSVILFQGGAYVSTMLTCIFGHRWKDLPHQFPVSVGTTIQRFIGYFLFWCITLPFCGFRPNRLKWLYDFKAVVLPPSVLGLLIYCLVQSKGKLADTLSLADQGTKIPRGATLGWLFVSSVNSSMGNWSTFIANMPDFSRYATSPRATFWTHILLVPIPATLGGMIGIFGTSAIQRAWGVTLWNQWDLLDAILAQSWTARTRFAIFLLAFSTALFTLGALVGANLLPFGSDSTALVPRYFNITRGMFFCCVVAFGLVPWKILGSAHGFLAFLGGYGIFMGPTAAIMISDYWIVRKGNIDVSQLYTSAPGSAYMYTGGFNLNAIAAYFCGMILPFTGFVGTFGVTVPRGAVKLNDLGWIVSTSVTFVMYVLFCRLRPLKNVDRGWGWEQLARGGGESVDIEDIEKVGADDGVVEVPVYVGEEMKKC